MGNKFVLDLLSPDEKKCIPIAEKIIEGIRISPDDALVLFNSKNLAFLGVLAGIVRRRKNGTNVYFNRNIHIEPTNICINHCKFCSYRRRKGEEGSWECTIDEMLQTVCERDDITEVHIVGGVHPDRDLEFYIELLKQIKNQKPNLHIKAFTAVEIDQMCSMKSVDIKTGLTQLKEAGLDSMPGGGAEIFDEVLRKKICPDKTTSEKWLAIHETAHQLGIPTNATMLYGLLENYAHRVDHLNRLRELQDKTAGFNVFIPLKFRNRNNEYTAISETTLVEDMKNYAVSRIFLDNIPHIKGYWPMIGKKAAQLSLAFGVDDLDGTIDQSTRIYSMAGADDQSPSASIDELVQLITQSGFTAIERDTLFNPIKNWSNQSIS